MQGDGMKDKTVLAKREYKSRKKRVNEGHSSPEKRANGRRNSPKRHWLIRLLILGLFLMGLAWGLTLIVPPPGGDQEAQVKIAFTPQNIQRGAYLARIGDCVACHSKPGEPMFSGGEPINSPIGGMVPSNITPDPQYGIGQYSYAEFSRAVRYGVARNGSTLYPAMPWPSYGSITEADMQALYAYFMKGVQPVARAAEANTIPWPLSIRWPVTYWRWLFGPKVPTPPINSPDEGIALGAYYVNGLGHCGACHTPRTLFMNEAAINEHDGKHGDLYLSGGQVIDGYATPNLRSDPSTGLGRLKSQDIAQLLKKGHYNGLATFGPMSEVITNSTQYMTDSDLLAMADYLKTLEPRNPNEQPNYYDAGSTFAQLQDKPATAGAQLYKDRCSACHLDNGFGRHNKFPALAQNPASLNPDPSALIQIVLKGGVQAQIEQTKQRYFMPAFTTLSDQEIADILTFVRSSWGNAASPVTVGQVSAARKNLSK